MSTTNQTESLPSDQEVMTDQTASAYFNSLSFEMRKTLGVHMNFVHIRHLEAEKRRLKYSYSRSVLEINQQIANIRESIRRG